MAELALGVQELLDDLRSVPSCYPQLLGELVQPMLDILLVTHLLHAICQLNDHAIPLRQVLRV